VESEVSRLHIIRELEEVAEGKGGRNAKGEELTMTTLSGVRRKGSLSVWVLDD